MLAPKDRVNFITSPRVGFTPIWVEFYQFLFEGGHFKLIDLLGPLKMLCIHAIVETSE